MTQNLDKCFVFISENIIINILIFYEIQYLRDNNYHGKKEIIAITKKSNLYFLKPIFKT